MDFAKIDFYGKLGILILMQRLNSTYCSFRP